MRQVIEIFLHWKQRSCLSNSQHNCCWSPGDARSQGIDQQTWYDLVLLAYSLAAKERIGQNVNHFRNINFNCNFWEKCFAWLPQNFYISVDVSLTHWGVTDDKWSEIIMPLPELIMSTTYDTSGGSSRERVYVCMSHCGPQVGLGEVSSKSLICFNSLRPSDAYMRR